MPYHAHSRCVVCTRPYHYSGRWRSAERVDPRDTSAVHVFYDMYFCSVACENTCAERSIRLAPKSFAPTCAQCGTVSWHFHKRGHSEADIAAMVAGDVATYVTRYMCGHRQYTQVHITPAPGRYVSPPPPPKGDDDDAAGYTVDGDGALVID